MEQNKSIKFVVSFLRIISLFGIIIGVLYALTLFAVESLWGVDLKAIAVGLIFPLFFVFMFITAVYIKKAKRNFYYLGMIELLILFIGSGTLLYSNAIIFFSQYPFDWYRLMFIAVPMIIIVSSLFSIWVLFREAKKLFINQIP